MSPNNISNTISIGYLAYATASNRVRIGNTNVTRIGGQVSWSTLSHGRFKKNVEDNVPGIEFIQQLRPVSYSYDYELFDKHSGFSLEKSTQMDEEVKKAWKEQQKKNEKIIYTGFIAQDVDEVIKKGKYNFSGVVSPESEKDHYSIRYAEFVVPLVKATQQQQEELIAQKAENDILRNKMEKLEQEIIELRQVIQSLANNSGLEQKIVDLSSPVICFPNPTTGKISLKIGNGKQEIIETTVYNLSGNLVYSKTSTESKSPQATIKIFKNNKCITLCRT